MIRPFTIATLLMACSSGLYLYQSKHEVQLLDRTIERTVRETGALREQSRLLATEWTMLNDPERLRHFSDTYLGLKTIMPAQFTSLADLDNRLPAALAELPAHGSDEQQPVPVTMENGASIVTDPDAAADEVLPVPPLPVSPPLPVVVSRQAEPRAEHVAVRQVVERPEVRPVEPRVADQHSSGARVADVRGDGKADFRAVPAPPPRPIALAGPRPVPANTSPTSVPQGPALGARAYALSSPPPAPSPTGPAMQAATAPYSAPYNGSLLGMARGGMPAAPRPTPVNASYNAN